MFPSKTRAVNYPQWEHARLAAWFAQHWAGELAVDRTTLVRGVLMHDRGYGWLDDDPLLGLEEGRWLELMRAGAQAQDSYGEDVDRIVRMHIRRLVADAPFGEEIDAMLGPSTPEWDAIDAVTNLCDRLSFDFCFEAASDRMVKLPGIGEVRYGLLEPGRLWCSPWLFNSGRITGHVVGYRRDGYPQHLVPELSPVVLAPR